MKAKAFTGIMIVMALLALLPLIITAGTTGKIKGTVTDKLTGKPIPGASVMIVGSTQGAMTGPDGKFVIENVQPGKYSLKFTALGYQTIEITEVSVLVDLVTEQDVKMEQSVADLSKIIKVTAEKDQIDRFSVTSQMAVPMAIEASKKAGRCNEAAYYPPAHGGTQIVNGEAFDAMFFKNYGVNPFVDTEDDHLSTFAVDVDDASFIMARSYLERGELPPNEAIRTEEFVNHFKYNYASPENGPFAVHIEGAPSIFGQNCQLLRIGIKGFDIRPENRKPANLVFVIDVSGSMGREDRLGLVRKSLRMLVDNLNSKDQVGIVVYGSSGRVILEPTSINEKEKILTAIEWLVPDGATNAEEGIRLGYQMADKMFEKGKINRIILCSDGVANVGVTGPDQILKQIKSYADKGITLTTVGFGMGNFNDILMEKLGNKGNGFYAYVDDFEEAKKIFLDNLTGTLQVIARDVKIQVDFDSNTVSSYRLLGYENRDLDDDKFRDDKEDGGEIGSGHQVTALYEIKFHKFARSSHIGTIFIRYKDPDDNNVTEINRQIMRNDFGERFENASVDFRLAATAAEFAEILRKSYWAKGSKLSAVFDLAKQVFVEHDSEDIVQLMDLISKAEKHQDELAEK
ncbi:MAG: hypothetical protein CVT49_03880 [candidate division Zixibacteria bacterium HGW-Zixibacteria-1]|nr:MAG: hypothetical protein CVT49_03880 [candidate division Zixibacteria bacterium HGW-Zixibacteria-1]